MKEITEKVEEMKEDFERLRDEIKLKAHLGKSEAIEELETLEKEWKTLLEKTKPLTEEAGKTIENTGAALELAADELKSGFDRIRKLF